MGQGRHTLRSVSDPVYPRWRLRHIVIQTKQKIENLELQLGVLIIAQCLLKFGVSRSMHSTLENFRR